MLAGCCRLFTCRKWVCMNYSPNRDHSSWQEPDGVVAAWDAVVRCWCHWACSFDLSQESHASSSLYVVKRALLTCAKKVMRPPLRMLLSVLFWLVPRRSCVLLFISSSWTLNPQHTNVWRVSLLFAWLICVAKADMPRAPSVYRRHTVGSEMREERIKY